MRFATFLRLITGEPIMVNPHAVSGFEVEPFAATADGEHVKGVRIFGALIGAAGSAVVKGTMAEVEAGLLAAVDAPANPAPAGARTADQIGRENVKSLRAEAADLSTALRELSESREVLRAEVVRLNADNRRLHDQLTYATAEIARDREASGPEETQLAREARIITDDVRGRAAVVPVVPVETPAERKARHIRDAAEAERLAGPAPRRRG